MLMLKAKYSSICIAVALSLVLAGSARAQDLIKDSDLDGISDPGEATFYQTDPLKADTDSDGYSDLIEIQSKADPLSAASTPENSIVQVPQYGWYISRIFGISAFILLTGVVIMGLTQTSKILIKVRIMGILVALKVHRLLSFLALTSLVFHVAGLFFDTYIKLTPLEAMIPFKLSRDVKSVLGFDLRFSVGLGIIAIYLIVILIFTSEQRGKLIPVRFWRTLHYLSFITYLLFLVHGILSGSDSTQLWMITIYGTSGLLVLFFLVLRIFKKRIALKSKSLPTSLPKYPENGYLANTASTAQQ